MLCWLVMRCSMLWYVVVYFYAPLCVVLCYILSHCVISSCVMMSCTVLFCVDLCCDVLCHVTQHTHMTHITHYTRHDVVYTTHRNTPHTTSHNPTPTPTPNIVSVQHSATHHTTRLLYCFNNVLFVVYMLFVVLC